MALDDPDDKKDARLVRGETSSIPWWPQFVVNRPVTPVTSFTGSAFVSPSSWAPSPRAEAPLGQQAL